jgi:hypothetical protein
MIAVSPDSISANGLWNRFSGKKKWSVTCGRCEHTWSVKIPIRDKCSGICPCCRAQNKWSSVSFALAYNKWIGN